MRHEDYVDMWIEERRKETKPDINWGWVVAGFLFIISLIILLI